MVLIYYIVRKNRVWCRYIKFDNTVDSRLQIQSTFRFDSEFKNNSKKLYTGEFQSDVQQYYIAKQTEYGAGTSILSIQSTVDMKYSQQSNLSLCLKILRNCTLVNTKVLYSRISVIHIR